MATKEYPQMNETARSQLVAMSVDLQLAVIRAYDSTESPAKTIEKLLKVVGETSKALREMAEAPDAEALLAKVVTYREV